MPLRTTTSARAGSRGIRFDELERLVPQEIERHVILFQLVDRLPDAQARVIRLRFVEQKSIKEIAQVLGRSEGAVKQLQLRAIENLRAQLEGAHG